MAKRGNALDWFHESVCSQCDRRVEDCVEGSGREIACILAKILYELQK